MNFKILGNIHNSLTVGTILIFQKMVYPAAILSKTKLILLKLPKKY
jgi:hypothetical protein